MTPESISEKSTFLKIYLEQSSQKYLRWFLQQNFAHLEHRKPSRGQSESVPKILLLSRLALENTNLQIYHLWWLTMNYQAYFCRFEQRTSNCTENINFVVKIFDKRFWFWEEINIWINFSERPIKKIPKSDKIKFLARLNQKLQEGGISKSSVSLVRVGQV